MFGLYFGMEYWPMLSIGELSESQARQICSWKYSNEYAVYNCPPWDTMISQGWGLADENKRKKEFKSVNLNGEFIGFFRLHFREDKLYLGLGLIPDCCGEGYGRELIEMIKTYANKHFPQNDLYLVVRDFNTRAIKTYQKAGFIIECEYVNNDDKYISMRYVVSEKYS